jgi:hypothetical protein
MTGRHDKIAHVRYADSEPLASLVNRCPPILKRECKVRVALAVRLCAIDRLDCFIHDSPRFRPSYAYAPTRSIVPCASLMSWLSKSDHMTCRRAIPPHMIGNPAGTMALAIGIQGT